jgi:hypothetical protein
MDLPENLARAGAALRFNLQQLALVAAGTKPGCRLKTSRDDLSAWWDRLTPHGLALAVGNLTISGASAPGRAGYREWAQAAPLTAATRGDCYLYVARSQQAADRLRRLEEDGASAAFGAELGYPDCCIASFGQHEGARDDQILTMYDDVGLIPWQMNVSLICFGWTLLQHFPCSQTCSASAQLARRYFENLYDKDAGYASKLAASLCTTVIHTRSFGVASAITEDDGNRHHIRAVRLLDPESPLASFLTEKSELGYLSPTERRVGSISLPISEARIFRFH